MQDLKGLAEGLSIAAGVSVTAEGNGERPLENLLLEGTLPDILNKLASEHDLGWWYDGMRYRIASARSNESRRIPLGDWSASEMEEIIKRAYPGQSRGLITIDELSRSILVRGPRALSDEVLAIAKSARAKQIASTPASPAVPAHPSAKTSEKRIIVIRYGKNSD
ncbi:MAG: hypothetical protein ACRCWF_06025 [Beijerinckiaceae bacterium]